MQKVIIASQNPIKIEAVKLGFDKMFPDEAFSFAWVSVPSGVSDQPLSNHEVFNGAMNRTNNAQTTVPDADYWVGIEAWIEKVWDEMEELARIIVKSATHLWRARTATFFLPPAVVELINQWMELWEADDIVFNRQNSKQQNGAVGILTGDVITRTTYYVEAVVLALIPFKNRELY